MGRGCMGMCRHLLNIIAVGIVGAAIAFGMAALEVILGAADGRKTDRTWLTIGNNADFPRDLGRLPRRRPHRKNHHDEADLRRTAGSTVWRDAGATQHSPACLQYD